jgi:hypothetical protein
MAVVITKAVSEQFDQNVTDNSGGQNVLGLALAADPEAARLFAPRPLTFSVEFTTTGSETVAIASAVMNLSTLGVLFPANTQRLIKLRHWSRRGSITDQGYVERVFTVKGAATFGTVLVGGQITGAFSVGLATSPDTLIAHANLAAGGEFGIPFVGIDATVGLFVVGYTAATAAVQTSLTVNVRNRIEVVVDPLVVLPVF